MSFPLAGCAIGAISLVLGFLKRKFVVLSIYWSMPHRSGTIRKYRFESDDLSVAATPHCRCINFQFLCFFVRCVFNGGPSCIEAHRKRNKTEENHSRCEMRFNVIISFAPGNLHYIFCDQSRFNWGPRAHPRHREIEKEGEREKQRAEYAIATLIK